MVLKKKSRASDGRRRRSSNRSGKNTRSQGSSPPEYRVVIQPSAEAEIEGAYLWLREHSAEGAVAWYNRLDAAIKSLAHIPGRCRLAPESHAFERDIRQLLV